MLKENVGTIDRIIRVVVGLAIISLVYVGPKTPFGWLGIIPLLTAAIGSCPLYSVFGWSTCATKQTPR